jgi:hypothetical protein
MAGSSPLDAPDAAPATPHPANAAGAIDAGGPMVSPGAGPRREGRLAEETSKLALDDAMAAPAGVSPPADAVAVAAAKPKRVRTGWWVTAAAPAAGRLTAMQPDLSRAAPEM